MSSLLIFPFAIVSLLEMSKKYVSLKCIWSEVITLYIGKIGNCLWKYISRMDSKISVVNNSRDEIEI